MSQQFTDLRLNNRNGSNEESFWPSFTDIMTVVVMIFLIAMLVLLINNMDLVQRLQATLAAERAASEQVETTSSLNRDLQAQLQRSEAELDMLRMQLMDMGDERDRLAGLQTQLQAALLHSQSELEQERGSKDKLATQLAEANQQLTQLADSHRQQEQRIRLLEQEGQQSAQKLAAMQGDYSMLKVKYDKLVRPARTAKGKYVVSVRIMRQGEEINRLIRSPEQKLFLAVEEEEMHRMLDKLHAEHADDMYVRIIFPDDSGLSYSEAWKMTESLLRKYDYYYRDSPLDSTGSK